MNIKLTAACVTLVALAACDTATPPTAGRTEFNAARVAYASAASNAPTLSTVATGGGTYRGAVTANARIAGEGSYSIIGDMAMNINLAASANNVTGQVSNINLIDDLTVEGDQLMGGTLNIAGSAASSNISATASGQLTAVLANSLVAQTGNVALQMTGRVRNDLSRIGSADVVSGTFTGTMNGTTTNGMDGSFSSGQFYGRE